ncbi:MAG: hypothetical protein ACREHE_17040 [Rhizomicrobium sp.]
MKKLLAADAATVLCVSAMLAGTDPVWQAASAARQDQLDLLASLVDIDSGPGDAGSGAKVAALLIPRLKALGAAVETVPAESPGLADNVVATLRGPGTVRILMIGHIDTVFGPGTVAARENAPTSFRIRHPPSRRASTC